MKWRSKKTQNQQSVSNNEAVENYKLSPDAKNPPVEGE